MKRSPEFPGGFNPSASHYLKLLLDAVFDTPHFENEIVWQRTAAKALSSVRLPNNHDVIFSYSKGDRTWNHEAAFVPYDDEDLDEKTLAKYAKMDKDGRRYQLTSLINPSADRPNLTYEFLGVKRVWRWTRERMQAAYERGEVVQTKPGTVPRYKRYLDEQRGKPMGDVWSDISPVNSRAAERLGYPTQKPVALLERIIEMSSKPGDLVLDPFCGCGTAVHAAQKLGREWVGIDITCLATNLIKSRMQEAFGISIGKATGEPTTLADANNLALEDRFQFQCWALGFVGARANDTKKGADGGIDGRLYFHEGTGVTKQIIFSVKSGGTQARDIRELQRVVAREKAEIGVLITLEKPTKPMRTEADAAGYYTSPWGTHKKTQILTIEDLLSGARVDFPVPMMSNRTVRKAARDHGRGYEQQGLPGIVKPAALRNKQGKSA